MGSSAASSPLKRYLASVGCIPRRKGRSLIIAGNGIDAVDVLLSSVRERYPRNHIVRIASTETDRENLTRRHPDDRILNEPLPFSSTYRRTLFRLKAHILLIAGTPAENWRRWLAEALKADVAVVLFDGGHRPLWEGGPSDREPPFDLDRITLFVVQDAGAADRLRELGVPEERVHAMEMTQASPEPPIERLFERIVPILANKQRAKRRFSLAGGKKRFLETGLGQGLISKRFRFIETLSDLRDDLRHPETILCLGNGPSSEDPSLRSVVHDCLFRVNHRWQERGLLTEPDMVFTGIKASIEAIGSGIILGLRDEAARKRLVSATVLSRPLGSFGRRFVFATIAEFGIIDPDDFERFRPTNGAIMLATAVALAPEKLIVAGIDLFEHPGGSYPGDSNTPNSYTLGHDRNTELRFILKTLDAYRGELTIVGDVLAARWQDYRRERDRPAVDAATTPNILAGRM